MALLDGPTRPLDLRTAFALAGLATWRATQGIYRIHPELRSALLTTSLAGPLPVDLLQRMPEWCVYVEMDGSRVGSVDVQGFWAFLNYNPQDGCQQLCLLIDTQQGIAPTLIELVHGATLEACILAQHKRDAQAKPGDIRVGKALWEPLISLILYLCSETAEYRNERGEPGRPANPRPVRTKKGWPPKVIPASQSRVWEVSYRLGAALAAARSRTDQRPPDETHASPRPHVRRAHWHTFLAGPKGADARERRLRWLPPIPVNVEDLEELIAVVRPLKSSQRKG